MNRQVATLRGGQEAHIVNNDGTDALGRTSDIVLATASVVAAMTDNWGPPTVRQVAGHLGLSADATYRRLMLAVDAGWLAHREGRTPAFLATAKLAERML